MTDQPRSPTIREAFVDIPGPHGSNKWRVYEPRPLKSLRVVGYVAKILGPMLVGILAGKIRLPKKESCPKCGEGGAEQINGERWLCRGGSGEERCGHAWPLEWLRDKKTGEVMRLTWAAAAGDPAWQLILAEAVSDQLNKLDDEGDKVEQLACDLLVGACEVAYPGGATHKITTAEDLEDQVSTSDNAVGALVALTRAAIASWVLPTLRGGLTATPRASTETSTAGA